MRRFLFMGLLGASCLPYTSKSMDLAPSALMTQVGYASWYGPGFHGKRTASGEVYDMYGMTAAHKTLPFGSLVRVVDLETGRSVVVRINDRGPYVKGRIIDLSYGAARELGLDKKGVAKVRIEVLSLGDDELASN